MTRRQVLNKLVSAGFTDGCDVISIGGNSRPLCFKDVFISKISNRCVCRSAKGWYYVTTPNWNFDIKKVE